MSRSDWCFFYTLVGCLALAALGLSDSDSRHSEQQRYQAYRYAADQPFEVAPGATSPAQAFENRVPCQNPKGKDESDLCAQWIAARAAQDGTLWAKWGFWVTVAGTIGLFWTLYYTRKAVIDTGDASIAMKQGNQIALANMRPHVFPVRIKMFADEGTMNNAMVSVGIENLGNSSARSLKVAAVSLIHDFPLPLETADNPKYHWYAPIDLPSRAKQELALPLAADMSPYADAIRSHKAAIFAFVRLEYQDMLGNEYSEVYRGYTFGEIEGVLLRF